MGVCRYSDFYENKEKPNWNLNHKYTIYSVWEVTILKTFLQVKMHECKNAAPIELFCQV